MKVLIAEDDRTSRLLLQTTLKKWDYHTIAVSNGREALEVLTAPDAPTLAILDWMMPGIDGLEVSRKVRQHPSERYTYIILLTARNRKQDMLEGMSAGADDYLTKPMDARELRVRLNAAERIIHLQEELIAAQESLRAQATHDALTGLWNRGAIFEILDKEIQRARRENVPVSAIMADLDKFKTVNDTYGHKAGDTVLHESARRMADVMRQYDTVGRYGGEEFLIVVPDCDIERAPSVAERLRECVAEKPFDIAGKSLDVTLSLGVAALDGRGVGSADTLLQAADKALYDAKNSGRNCAMTTEVACVQGGAN